MKIYYKSKCNKTIVEVTDSSERMGVVIHDPRKEYTIGKKYEFMPFSEDSIWEKCSIQDIPYAVSLKDVSNLILSQKFLDWFNSSEAIHSGDVFPFLKENLDVK